MKSAYSISYRVKVTNIFAPIALICFEIGAIYGAMQLFGLIADYSGSAVIFIISMFTLTFAALILPVVLLNKIIRYQQCRIGKNGLFLERKGFIPFSAVKSYDTDAVAFGEAGRLYLHIRPCKGMAFRLTPSLKKQERRDFLRLCRVFQLTMEQACARGVRNAPVQQSFWGSKLAKAIGLFGLMLEILTLVGILLFAPHMMSYAGYALVIATPVFLAILAGKRPR